MESSNNRIKNVISSSHINFLFGAGVNGKAFPQLSGFAKTIGLLENFMGRKVGNFEDDINSVDDNEKKSKVYKEFVTEFNEFSDKIDFSNSSLIHLKELLVYTYKVVENSENRQKDMKQINIYTLNYDNIVEKLLDLMGYLNNSVSASNLGSNIRFFDLVAYDYTTYKYVPTFVISKLHGDIERPILPGIDKYETSLQSEYFEINYRMKEQLCKFNSVLFVIGYSCNDNHINKILLDCIKHDLVIIWFKYKDDDKVLENCPPNQLIVIEPNDTLQDTTLTCKEYLEENCE